MSNATLSELLCQLQRRILSCTDEDNSLRSLNILRLNFSLAIPYENLSVLSGDNVSLRPIDVLTKLSRKRGGYCFELNTAFAELLKARGLSPTMHLGRVWLRSPNEVPPRNHSTNVIHIEGRPYIADVGFGARAPRCLVPLFDFGLEIDDGDADNEPIRAIEDNQFGVMIQRRINGEWNNQYSLELTPAHMTDILAANHYQASGPDSHFRHHLFVGRFTRGGRDGLFDNRLTRRIGTETEVKFIKDLDEMCDVLRHIFDIDPTGYESVLAALLNAR